MKRSLHSSRGGFSLVISLIILTLLAILVVSFISTSTLERTTARAFVNKAAAEIAAQTATNQAISLLTERITKFPDSVTVWEPPLTPASGGYPFEGTVLYYSKHATDTEERNDPSATRWMLPLVSRGVDINGQLLGDVAVGDRAQAQGPDAWTDANSLDLNRPRSNTDTAGWIGAAPDGRRPFRARWNEVQTSPTSPAATGKTISRYAFWMEDESFKVNLNSLDNNLLNAAGATGRGSETIETARIDKAQPLPPQIAGLTPIQGLLRSARAPYPANKLDAWATNVRNLRKGWFGKQLFELRAFTHADLTYPDSSDPSKDKTYAIGDEAKFLATIYSGGLNVSRHGSQRVNLNGLGFDAVAPDAANPPINGIERIVETIKYHAPKFGQRFYRSSTATSAAVLNADTFVTDPHANIYLHKVAANIRDYIDPDTQPTLLIAPTAPGTIPTVAPQAKPSGAMFADDSDNKYWAQGKESAPFIQEAVVRLRTTCTAGTTKNYELKVDYYIEVWNMTDKTLLAKDMHNPFLMISDPVGWFGHKSTTPAGSTSPLTATNDTPTKGNPYEDRDLVIDIRNNVKHGDAGGAAAADGVEFQPGTFTVITTDPDGLPAAASGTLPATSTTGGINKPNTYYCPTLLLGKRFFSGPVPTGSDGIWMVWRDAVNVDGKGISDYGTAVILGNDLGYIDCAPYALALNNSSTGPYVTYVPGSGTPTTRDDTYGGSLLGNSNTPSQLGDPRTNNEQLTFCRYKSGGVTVDPDVTRYANPPSGTGEIYRFSLGWANARFVYPYSAPYPWKDYYKVWTKIASGTSAGALSPTADTAAAFVANENLKSIGQLGDIYDPARILGNSATLTSINYSRGGGRTFKLGQKDDLVDTTSATAKSQGWASWRLTDFFDISNDIYQPGLININGLRRDNGAALRAACYGMTIKAVSQVAAASGTTPTVTPADTLNSQETATAGVQKVIDQAIVRLKNDPSLAPASYFRERGELSDLDVYSAATTDLLKKDPAIVGSADAKMSESFDHTREELFRRLSSQITTRGNVFSVYAVGQSLTVGVDGKTRYVTGEHWVKTTFALLPKKADGTDFQVKQETFIPTDSSSRTARFAKPDHYDIQLLQVSTP